MITVDEPSLSVVVGINTSPLAGQDGSKLTARQVRARLDQELVGNVSIRVEDTERPDAWEVQGRGELQLAVLVELMRREGFELTVGQPQVVTREIDGKVHEPVERLAIDVPEDYVGVVTQLLALRKGRLEQMINHGTGWVRMDYLVPARGLIGFRTDFVTETRGTGILHHVFDRWEPWAGEVRTRPSGALVADRRGETASFALFGLQERGTLFVGPGEEVYEGMIVGENAKPEDLDVNAVKEKHLTNIRSSTADVLVRLVPARRLSLDQALEFLREDEAVEVTPHTVRLRKLELDKGKRVKLDTAGEGGGRRVTPAATSRPAGLPRGAARALRPLGVPLPRATRAGSGWRLEAEGAWDAVVEDGEARLVEAPPGEPDSRLIADAATWRRIARDVRGGMAAYREGKLRVRVNLHLGRWAARRHQLEPRAGPDALRRRGHAHRRPLLRGGGHRARRCWRCTASAAPRRPSSPRSPRSPRPTA